MNRWLAEVAGSAEALKREYVTRVGHGGQDAYSFLQHEAGRIVEVMSALESDGRYVPGVYLVRLAGVIVAMLDYESSVSASAPGDNESEDSSWYPEWRGGGGGRTISQELDALFGEGP